VTARLASSVLVSALLRRAQDEGGFGAVLAKGEPDGAYAWQASARPIESDMEFQALLDRRRKVDPDLWILELDVASAERFAAEMNAVG